METEPPDLGIIECLFNISLFSVNLVWYGASLILLLLMSGLMSGSEVAFFSLNKNQLGDLEEEESSVSTKILELTKNANDLLATILVFNNFVNIAIVIVSTLLLNQLIGAEALGVWAQGLQSVIPLAIETWVKILDFVITIFLVTSILVLFGEIAPKIYANINNVRFAKFMAKPLTTLCWLLSPITNIMVKWSTAFENKISPFYTQKTSKEELDKAIELTVSQEIESDGEADILKSILKFGDVAVKQIMKSRVDVIALEHQTEYPEVLKLIKDHGYSRIPIYREEFDNIEGILYVKDLIGYINNDKLKWQNYIRKDILYVPEYKKIDELLKDFQSKRLHMAIVVDEFGGSAGIVTLEDIMEEVIGDIKDEFDEIEEVEYEQIDDDNFIFEGKTLLNDVARIIDEDTTIFDKMKGSADSLAGLVLEIAGEIPDKEKEYSYDRFRFKIMAVNQRRIEKIHINIIRLFDEDSE